MGPLYLWNYKTLGKTHLYNVRELYITTSVNKLIHTNKHLDSKVKFYIPVLTNSRYPDFFSDFFSTSPCLVYCIFLDQNIKYCTTKT